MDRASNKYWSFYICAGLILAALVAFEPVRRSEFVGYDDNIYVTENPHAKAGLTRQSIIWAFTTTHTGNWHPLTWLSHILDCKLFGLNPLWHHLVSLLFHIANTLLLFWLLKEMTRAPWPSAFVAAAFAVHPLHVESVAWIAERKDVLSSLFWFLTIAAYIRYAKRPNVVGFLPVILAFCLGLMAKPMLVTLPFVLLLLDYWPLQRFQWQRQIEEQALPLFAPFDITYQKSPNWYLFCEKIPLFVLTGVSCVITYIVQQAAGALEMMKTLSPNIRISNALISYSGYILKIIYPTRLAVLYPLSVNAIYKWQAAVSLIVLIAISAGIIYMAGSRRYLIVGWLWYLGTLVPVIGLVQVGSQAMADRYTYLPSIGIFIIVAWGSAELLTKWRYQAISLRILGGLLICVMVFCTRAQIRYWKSDFTLYQRALAVTRDNFIIHHNYGYCLSENGQPEEAIKHFTEALRIKPDYDKAHLNLGVVLASQGKLDEAIEHFNEALRINPGSAEAYCNLGSALNAQGKLGEAVVSYMEALRINPNLAEVHYNLGIIFIRLRSFDKAAVHLSEALRIKPDFTNALNKLGYALISQGKLDEAVSEYRKFLQRLPDSAETHNNLGIALAIQGKFNQAIEHFTEAIRLKPDFADAHRNLGFALTREGKLTEAIAHLTEAVRLNPDSALAHYFLGSALTNDGRIDEAKLHFEEALRIDPNLTGIPPNLKSILE